MNYVTTKEAAQMLGLKSYRTVIKYLKLGYLKGRRFGTIWMVYKPSVLDRIAEKTNS